MPPNRVACIRRKYRLADKALRAAQVYLASIHNTVLPQHPGIAGALRAEVDAIDDLRRLHLDYYREHWGGTERGLWKSGDLADIMDTALVIQGPEDRR